MSRNNVTNEFAKERTREAAERTLTSWMQSCLALISFGFVFAGLAKGGTLVGLGAIAAGVTVLVAVTVLHMRQIVALDHADHMPASNRLRVVAMTAILIAFGVVALTATFLRP